MQSMGEMVIMYKLINNKLVSIPSNGKVDGVYYGNLKNNEALQSELGYKPLVIEEKPEGRYVEIYSETEDSIICSWIVDESSEVIIPYQISKYKFLLALDELQLLDSFEVWISNNKKTKLLWGAAINFESHDSLFLSIIDQIKDELNLNDAQISNLLNESRV